MTGAGRSIVDDVVYDRLIRLVDPRSLEDRWADPSLRPDVEQALHHEARLLDSRSYRHWLDRFTPDCVYWVPIDPTGDPRRQVSFFLDDRRRMEDRIGLLETGWAHAQIPPSRACRLVSNVEAWPEDDGEVRARCTVMTWEHRRDRLTPFVSHNDYVFATLGEDWSIRVKVVTLVDSIGDVEKFSFVL